MTEPGTRTEDLNAIHPAPPGAHPDDEKLNRLGRRSFWAGISICVLTAFAALATAVAADSNAFQSTDGKLFAVLAYVALIATGTSLTIVGGASSQHAHTRARTAELRGDLGDMRGDIDRNRRRLDQQAGEIHDLEMTVRSTLNAIMPLASLLKSIPERMDGLETATAAIAEHLPDALKSENWRGFNAAVREGFTGQQTGTDGQAKRRPPHIGLVPPRGEAGDKP